jgi:hypothetical protein
MSAEYRAALRRGPDGQIAPRTRIEPTKVHCP